MKKKRKRKDSGLLVVESMVAMFIRSVGFVPKNRSKKAKREENENLFTNP